MFFKDKTTTRKTVDYWKGYLWTGTTSSVLTTYTPKGNKQTCVIPKYSSTPNRIRYAVCVEIARRSKYNRSILAEKEEPFVCTLRNYKVKSLPLNFKSVFLA